MRKQESTNHLEIYSVLDKLLADGKIKGWDVYISDDRRWEVIGERGYVFDLSTESLNILLLNDGFGNAYLHKRKD